MLLPCFAWCVLADFLKNVAITAGPVIASQAGFAPWQREAIAFAFQFGSLILPAVRLPYCGLRCTADSCRHCGIASGAAPDQRNLPH